tara:strand:+ start:839 stop:1186 length:348 start_codon:yes stop_codon:yes gene_type:complete
MSEEEKMDLTAETVHGIKNRWMSWDEPKEVEPEVSEPEPVAEEPAPAPEPEPVPEPPAPVECCEDWVCGTTLNNMADHLRREKRLKITIDQAKEMILNDEETKAIYKNHQIRGKF